MKKRTSEPWMAAEDYGRTLPAFTVNLLSANLARRRGGARAGSFVALPDTHQPESAWPQILSRMRMGAFCGRTMASREIRNVCSSAYCPESTAWLTMSV